MACPERKQWGGRRGAKGGWGEAFDRLKRTLRAKPIHIAEGISWVLPTVMSNKVCCKAPTLPLCCDTESCQKILKSLHELGDGSCNCLSYCLAAAALPHCCWPPLWSVLHLFALSLATESTKARSGRVAAPAPSPLQERMLTECGCGETPPAASGRSSVSLGPAPSPVLHRSARLQGTLDKRMAQRRARTPRHTHQMRLFLSVCVAFSPPSLLAPNELEQYRQLQALPVLHLLPKTSSK